MAEIDDEIASSPVIPEALPGRLIVEFPKDELTRSSGLILVKSIEEKNVATVIDVGLGTDESEKLFARQVRPGDRVICQKMHGDPFKVGDRELFIFRMFQVIGRLPKEAA